MLYNILVILPGWHNGHELAECRIRIVLSVTEGSKKQEFSKFLNEETVV